MMKTLKRLTTSLLANFDWAVTQIENHEALVNAALRDIQSTGAKAKVQLNRVLRDGENLRRRLHELKEAEKLWAERAVRCAQLDQEKAIECLQRRRHAQVESKEIEVQVTAHKRLAEDLAQDLKVIDTRIEELKRKRNSMRGRESTAQALSAIQSQDLGLIDELDDVFERWEIKVSQYDRGGVFEIATTRDLEEGFKQEEQRVELKAELEQLLREASVSESTAHKNQAQD